MRRLWCALVPREIAIDVFEAHPFFLAKYPSTHPVLSPPNLGRLWWSDLSNNLYLHHKYMRVEVNQVARTTFYHRTSSTFRSGWVATVAFAWFVFPLGVLPPGECETMYVYNSVFVSGRPRPIATEQNDPLPGFNMAKTLCPLS